MNNVKETIKGELRELVTELIRIIATYKGKGISEADTKAKLIEQLFEKLGWDIRGEEIVRAHIIRSNWKPVDYLFKIGDEPRLLMEAKKLDDSITLEDASSLVEYGNATGISWCVLTNGNEIKLYNSDWPESIEKKLFFEVSVTSLEGELDERFDNFFETVWLLSRESVRSGELDKEGTREYAKRVVLEIWSEERTEKFLVERAKFKKVSEKSTREAIKELEVIQLFPFPARVPEELILPKEEKEVGPPPEEKIIAPPTEEVIPPPEEIVTPPSEEVITPSKEAIVVIEQVASQIKEKSVREAFNTTAETFRKLGRDVIEEAHPKSIVYKVKDKAFVKLKPYKSYFQIEIFNLSTGKWLSFDVEKGNLDRVKDRVNRAKGVYKEMRKK